MSEFKKFNLKAGHNLNPDDLKFLGYIDEALVESEHGMQKQLNQIFLQIDPLNQKFAGSDHYERKQAAEWIRKFFKKEQQPAGFGDLMRTDGLEHDGGYLVPELLYAEIQHYTQEFGICRRNMRYLPFGGPGNTRKIPTEASGVSVQWVDEAGMKPLTSITLGLVVQELKKLAAIAVITEELMEDSAVDIVSYLARRIAEKISEAEDRMFFNGDLMNGDPFNGMLHAPGVTTLNMGEGLLPENIQVEDLLKLVYELPTPARTGAAFYMHTGLMYYLQKLRIDLLAPADGLGGFLVQQPISGEPAKMWGYPIILTDALPAPDDVGVNEPFLIFANLQKSAVYGEKQGVRVKLLDQATLTDGNGNTINLAQSDAVACRVHKRVGYAITLPEGIGVLKSGLEA